MADSAITAQLVPAATNLEDLYEVPAATTAAIRVTACNQGVDTTFRLSLAPLGAADDPEQYAYFDVPIAAGESFATTIFMMAATDVLRCYSDSGDVSFMANGLEIT